MALSRIASTPRSISHNWLIQLHKLAMRGAPAMLLFPENRESISENPFFGASGRLSRQIHVRIAMTYGRFPARRNSEAQLGDQGSGLVRLISWVTALHSSAPIL
jgi:hypothetical protein